MLVFYSTIQYSVSVTAIDCKNALQRGPVPYFIGIRSDAHLKFFDNRV